MARKRPKKLTHASVNSVSKAGRYGDARGGHGLSLLVKETTIPGRWSKTWSQSLRVNGSAVTVGLGAYPAVTLAMARAKALENATLAAQGINPRAPKPSIPTVNQAFDQLIAMRTPTWTSEKTAGNWARTKRFCQPIGSMLVSDIKPADVLEILENVWTTNPNTARDVRSKLSSVFQLTIDQGHRDSDPANRKITRHLGRQPRKSHYQSIDHTKLGSALKLIRDAHTWWAVKMALIFLALTCTRSSEVLKATWDEFDLDSEFPTWTIPASRMKTRLAHTVPLSTQAVEVLLYAEERTDGVGLVFPPQRGGPFMQGFMLSLLLNRLNIPCVPHGLRSTFRNWAGRNPEIPFAPAERVLAHEPSNAVVAAYLNDEFVEERQPIMQTWADYICGPMGTVLPQ